MNHTLRVGFLASAIVLALAANGCAKRNKGPSKAEREALKEFILDDMPGDVTNKVDVNFEDRVHLLGWKAEPAMAAPGTTVRVTLFWKKTGDLEDGWMVFTHVTGDKLNDNRDCAGPIRQDHGDGCKSQVFGPSAWEKGKVIKDTFEYAVPNDIQTTSIRFLLGIWKGDARLTIKNAEAADGENRCNIVVLQTGWKAPEPPPTKAGVREDTTPRGPSHKFGVKADIKLDGKLDEPLWLKAGLLGPFVGPGDGKPVADASTLPMVKTGWDEENLYFAVTFPDKDPKSPFKDTDKDPHIWEKSSGIEFMIQPGNPGDNKDYYEIQVDSNGAVFDTHWDDYNVPITGGPDEATKVFGHMEWSSGLKKGISIDKAAGTWTTEVAIPWKSFVNPRPPTTLPPKGTDTWRVNVYVFRDGQRYALAWSPTLGEGNFHKSSRFGILQFMEPLADMDSPTGAPSGSASAKASAGASASAKPPASTSAAPSISAKPVIDPGLKIKVPKAPPPG